jgi:hypothetical protein
MQGEISTGRLRPVMTRHKQRAQDLSSVLGQTTVDERNVEQHGLAWWYPQLKQWPTVRSVGAGGGGGKASLPLNAEALDFLGGHYWIGESSQDRCSEAELMDEENYRLGFEPTVLELEKSVRRALGQNPPVAVARAADPLAPTPAVVAALAHLLEVVDAIAALDFLTDLVLSEAVRLVVRARGMMHGSRFTASRSQCQYCFETESVISDEDRAVCINPWCRTPEGGRRCWRVDAETGQWVEVSEPTIRGRGQVSDEQLSRWADVG